MKIAFDAAKPPKTLKERGLDFADAEKVFAGRTATREDTRQEYGERRFATAGHLNGRMAQIVWTPRDSGRRIVSMRHCHGKKAAVWQKLLD